MLWKSCHVEIPLSLLYKTCSKSRKALSRYLQKSIYFINTCLFLRQGSLFVNLFIVPLCLKFISVSFVTWIFCPRVLLLYCSLVWLCSNNYFALFRLQHLQAFRLIRLELNRTETFRFGSKSVPPLIQLFRFVTILKPKPNKTDYFGSV